MKNLSNITKLLIFTSFIALSFLIHSHSASAISVVSPTGGDGYTPIVRVMNNGETHVFTIYHHQKPSGTTTPNYNINCVDATTDTICAGYPKYFNSTAGTDNTGVNDIATSYYPHYAVVGSQVYFAAQRTNDNGIACFDLELGENCGYTQLGSLPMTSNATRPSAVDGVEQVGTQIFSFGSDLKAYCYDLNTQAACTGQPYAVNTGDSTMPAYDGTDFRAPRQIIGTNIYFIVNYWSQSTPADARLTCFDTTTDARCAGWTSGVDLPGTNVSTYEGDGSVFASYDTTGNANAVCVNGYAPDGPSCFDLNDGTSVAAPSGLLTGLPAAYAREETRLGNKTYFAFYQAAGGYAVCYDFTTDANCTGFADPQFWPTINGGNTRDYGYTYSSLGCFFATGDAAILWSFDPTTGVTGDGSCPSASSSTSGSTNQTASSSTTAPKTPNTGLSLITSHPLLSLIIASLSATAIVYFGRRYKLATQKVSK